MRMRRSRVITRIRRCGSPPSRSYNQRSRGYRRSSGALEAAGVLRVWTHILQAILSKTHYLITNKMETQWSHSIFSTSRGWNACEESWSSNRSTGCVCSLSLLCNTPQLSKTSFLTAKRISLQMLMPKTTFAHAKRQKRFLKWLSRTNFQRKSSSGSIAKVWTVEPDASTVSSILSVAPFLVLPWFTVRIGISSFSKIDWSTQLKLNSRVGGLQLENLSLRILSWCSMLAKCSVPTLMWAPRESKGTSTQNVLTWWELRITRSSTLHIQAILQGSLTIVAIQIVRLASGPSKTKYVSASLPKRISKKMKSWLLITSLTSSKQLSPSVTAALQNAKASSEWPEIREERMILPLQTRSVMRRSWTQILETSLSTRKFDLIERQLSWLQVWTKRAPSASLARRW